MKNCILICLHCLLYRLLPLCIALSFATRLYPVWNNFYQGSCLVPNIIMGVWALKITDCSYCYEISQNVQLRHNVSALYFMENFSFKSQPVLVKGASIDWPATNHFSFNYFKHLYQERIAKRGHQSEQDQITISYFTYRSCLYTFDEFLSLTDAEALNGSWYISWNTQDPYIRSELHSHLREPAFLPPNSSEIHTAAIYMGTPGPAASIHIDSVGLPTWQAQLSGTKTWTLLPLPECEHKCDSINITVEQGDIIVVDNHRWYHSTHVHEGSISISYGTEFV